MPQINTGRSNVNQKGKSTGKRRRRRVVARDAEKARKAKTTLNLTAPRGDTPTTRKSDTNKAEIHKQTSPYIADLQNARGKRYQDEDSRASRGKGGKMHDTKVGPIFKQRTLSAKEVQQRDDARYFEEHRRVTPKKQAAGRPGHYIVDPSSGRATFKPDTNVPVDKKLPVVDDEPRTKEELRQFLKVGKRPQGVQVKVSTTTGNPLKEVNAPALFVMKQSARPLHATAAGLQGKNVKEGFTKGHDTGSDVIKHYLGKPKSTLGKIATAVGGFGLDWYIDPLNRAKVNVRSPGEKLSREAGRAEAKSERAASRGKTGKAKRYKTKAEAKRTAAGTARTNRGVQVGVILPGRRDFQTSGNTTAKIGGSKAGQAVGKLAHDNPVSQAVGKAFVPHHRDKDMPKGVHKTVTEAKRRKRHREFMADREAERRGQAYQKQAESTPDSPEALAAAIERAPVGATPRFKWKRRTSDEQKAVKAAEHKLRSAKVREARDTGKAQVEDKFATRRTLRETRDLAKSYPNDSAAVIVRQFDHAVSKHHSASRGLNNAKKNWRNAHANRDLYTDTERAGAVKRLHNAQTTLEKARAELDEAKGLLESTAEAAASRAAARANVPVPREMRTPPDSPLAKLGRAPTGPLNRALNSRANLAAAYAERDAAVAAKAGKPNTVREFREVTGDGTKGRTWEDFYNGAPKHSPASLSPQGQAIATQHAKEMDAVETDLKNSGLLKDGHVENYLHHMKEPESIVQRAGRMMGRGRPANAPLTRARRDPRPVVTQNEHRTAEPFSTDVPTINANYIRDARRAIADADYLKTLRSVGRPVTAGGKLADNERAYAITDKGIKELDDHQIAAFLAGKPAAEGEHVVLPKVLGDEEKKLRSFDGRDAIGQAWDKMNSGWKTVVTVYNAPYYQLRNVYDDTLRFWYGDGDVASFNEAARLMAKQVSHERGERHLIPRGDQPAILRQAEEDGAIRAGHFAADFENAGGKVKVSSGTSKTQVIRNTGSVMEDVPRLATYLSALKRGMTREQAADWTRIHHFDYTELTDAERWIRRFIPFWTFTSRNMALQFRTLATRPGKFSQFEAFREEMAKLAGLEDGWDTKYLNETQQRALPVPFRVGPGPEGVKVFYPSLSNTDLNRLPLPVGGKSPMEVTQQQFDMWRQTITPLAKAPWEILDNHSFFFREPIYRSGEHPDAPKWVPAPTWANNPVVKEILQKLGRTVIDDYEDPHHPGKKILAWPAEVDYMLRQFPQSGDVATMFTPSRNQNDQDAGDRIRGRLTGIRQTSLDPTKGESERLRQRIANNQIELQNLNDRVGARTGPDREFHNSVQYQKLSDAIKTDTDRLRTLSKKQDRPRIDSIPDTIEETIRKRLETTLKNTTPEAIDARVKRRLEEIRLKYGGG